MVKNISNPINARKVASLIFDDAQRQQIKVDAREISIFLADRRFDSLDVALKQLREERILPPKYRLSSEGTTIMVEQDFLEEDSQLSGVETDSSGDDFLDSLDIDSMEFKTQLENLKSKVLQSWSGGISVDGHEMDNFERKFGRPMRQFVEHMAAKKKEISDLQAFTVVYATDQLALGDNSKEDIFYLIFDRFDEVRDELNKHYGITYEWPTILGTAFIDIGKRLCVSAELAEFGKRFRSISGIDTYPDEVIQVFFYELISGSLTEELVRKKLFYRWADKPSEVEDYHRWFIPPSNYAMDDRKRQLLLHAIMTHTLLLKIDPENTSLLGILKEIHDLSSSSQVAYLAQKLEASLTRKAVSLQFATTLSNFFENFKTNPSRIKPFIETTMRYYDKAGSLETVVNSIYHSIRTGLTNSTGILRKYLRAFSEDKLTEIIYSAINQAVERAIVEVLGGNFTFDIYDILDRRLSEVTEEMQENFFTVLLDQVYQQMHEFARDLEPQREEPQDSSGGLTELTRDFISTVMFYGPKNTNAVQLVQELTVRGFEEESAQWIAYISSYMTYQVASKEGTAGETLHQSLCRYFEEKYAALAQYTLADGTPLRDQTPLYQELIFADLQQAQALIHLASKARVDIYNAWTPLPSNSSKAALYLNSFVLPNLLYWQRLPQHFITQLQSRGLIDRTAVRELVDLLHRLSMLEAYALIIIGMKTAIASIDQAREKISQIFNITSTLEEAFQLNPRQGEAEIAREVLYLWHTLQEES